MKRQADRYLSILIPAMLILFLLCGACQIEPVANETESIKLQETDHFKIRYLDIFPDQLIAQMANSLEFSWEVITKQLGYEIPQFVINQKINVFVGADRSGVYSDGSEFQFKILFAKEDVENDAYSGYDWAIHVCPHELFHVFQLSEQGYREAIAMDHSLGFWWKEGTADWVTRIAYPDHPDRTTIDSGALYLRSPHYSIAYFNGWDSWYDEKSPETYFGKRFYGTWLFAWYMTRILGNDIIKESWLDGEIFTNSLHYLERNLKAQGIELFNLFADFAAWTVHLDGLAIASDLIQERDQAMVAYNYSITANFNDTKSGWQQVPENLRPQAYAFNVIKWQNPNASANEAVFNFVADPTGSLGSNSQFQIRIIKKYADRHSVSSVPVSELTSYTKIDLRQVEILYFVFITGKGNIPDRETFSYQYKVQPK